MAKIEEESTWLLKKIDRIGEDYMSKGPNTAQRQGHCRQLSNWAKGEWNKFKFAKSKSQLRAVFHCSRNYLTEKQTLQLQHLRYYFVILK